MPLIQGDSYENEGLHYIPSNHVYTLIFMHGLGDTAEGWSSLYNWISKDNDLHRQMKLIIPTAPIRPISMMHGFEMRAWGDIYSLSPDKEDDVGYMKSYERINHYIEKEIEKGILPKNIYIGGFSQGAAMSYLVSMKSTRQLGGIIVLSGWIPLISSKPQLFSKIHLEALKIPILHCHGQMDFVVDFKWGSASMEKSKALGYNVTWCPYPDLNHGVCDEELQKVFQFIKNK